MSLSGKLNDREIVTNEKDRQIEKIRRIVLNIYYEPFRFLLGFKKMVAIGYQLRHYIFETETVAKNF